MKLKYFQIGRDDVPGWFRAAMKHGDIHPTASGAYEVYTDDGDVEADVGDYIGFIDGELFVRKAEEIDEWLEAHGA